MNRIENKITGVHLKTNSMILIFLIFQFLDNSKFLRGDENNNVKQLSKENATIKFANELSVISIRQSKKSQLFKQT